MTIILPALSGRRATSNARHAQCQQCLGKTTGKAAAPYVHAKKQETTVNGVFPFNMLPEDEPFEPTPKQREATKLIGGPAMHVCLVGGARSGKTLTAVRAIIFGTMKHPGSRHVIFRLTASSVRHPIWLDTLPKVRELGRLDMIRSTRHPDAAPDRDALIARIRHWTREGLLETVGDLHPGTGRPKGYPWSAVYDAAVLNALADHGVQVGSMYSILYVARDYYYSASADQNNWLVAGTVGPQAGRVSLLSEPLVDPESEISIVLNLERLEKLFSG